MDIVKKAQEILNEPNGALLDDKEHTQLLVIEKLAARLDVGIKSQFKMALDAGETLTEAADQVGIGKWTAVGLAIELDISGHIVEHQLREFIVKVGTPDRTGAIDTKLIENQSISNSTDPFINIHKDDLARVLGKFGVRAELTEKDIALYFQLRDRLVGMGLCL